MVARSVQNQIDLLEIEVYFKNESIERWQRFADSLPAGVRKDFYLWRIKSIRDKVADLEQEISDLKRQLRNSRKKAVRR